MTRYNNPLPHAQVPPSQGRPASSGHHAPQHPHQQGYAEPELTGWPRPPAGQQRPPAAGSYPDLGYPSHDAAQHDPYAALRPEGYGSAPQPAASPDPYGLAGYTAPQGQPGAAPGYPGRPAPQGAPSHAYDALGAAGQAGGYPPAGYGAAPGQGHHFGSPGLAQPAGAGDYAGYGHQQPGHSQPGLSADQWGAHDPHALGAGSHDYGAQDPYADPQAHAQWAADGYGHPGDPALGHDPYQGVHPGQHGTFDQSYAEDDALYEEESGSRGSWKKAAALLVSTVIVGGGLVYGASGLMGPGDGGDAPPLVRGAAGPSKVKPSEPGGKQFDHTDSKIMGRLGEASSSSDEGSGVRRVPVVSVGRDGSIQPPPSGGQRETQAIVSVPGLTVIDNFGGPPGPGGAPSNSAPSRSAPASSGALSPTRSAAPKVEMVTGAESSSSSSGSSSSKQAAAPTKAPPAPKADAPKKVAAASPSAPTGPRPTGAGYVAVLASVPVSASSRIDALTQFADMQQKYGNILSSKTPDIQEANLGAKGTYHRLLVGPPGSRDSANSVCNQLKAQGYEGCWITAY